MNTIVIKLICAFLAVTCGQSDSDPPESDSTPSLHNEFSEKIGNFSLELLYHSSRSQEKGYNMVIAPLTVWTVMAVIAEGASGDTLRQINFALRLTNNRTVTRLGYQSIAKWLEAHTSTVELEKLNVMFIDKEKLPLRDFQNVAKTYYKTEVIPLDFRTGTENLTQLVNSGISEFTHGRIPKLVNNDFFSDGEALLASALYFKGQWTVPFNKSSTTVRPFYNSHGLKIGEVNMMYNRFTYPFANIKELQARVIELPYGAENRLSMLILVPYPNVSLEDMFLNFKKVPLDTIFAELRISHEEFADDQVDCFIPRFKITSNLDLTDTLKTFGIVNIFHGSKARLPYMARTPLYVTKVIHKAEIEVTEEGTEAAGVTGAELSNRIGAARFEANRPFSYVIIEKVTNSIVFGGFYEYPSLF